MKTILASAMALALLATAPTAMAESATITVTGRILPGTCTLGDIALPLNEIRASDIELKENEKKTLTLKFRDCIGVGSVDMTFNGTPHESDADLYRNDAVNGTQGIGIALTEKGVSGSARWLKNGATRNVPIRSGAADFDMEAAYYRGASFDPIFASDVSAAITVNLVYN